MTDALPEHVPVLSKAVAEHLGGTLPGVVVDCTLGLGGHASLLLERNPGLQLVGVDWDAGNLEQARKRLERFGDRVRLLPGNFADAATVLTAAGIGPVGGLLADLGVSSNQLADFDRGFSFEADGPLDMRMDRDRGGPTAADLVNSLQEGELADLLYLQSQERHSRRIARRICHARRQGRLNSSVALARLVASAVGEGPGARRSRIHPATRTFMALRMAVNHETENLRRLLEDAPGILALGGRIAVISFHSVEDRIVKQDFQERSRQGRYRLLTKKPIRPDEEEVDRNPRSRSAKLRVAELLSRMEDSSRETRNA